MKEAYYGNLQKIKQQKAIQKTFEAVEREGVETSRSRKVLIDAGVSRAFDFSKEESGLTEIKAVINEIIRMKEYIKKEYTALDYELLTKELTLAEEYGKKGDMGKVKEALAQGGRYIGIIAKIINCPVILRCLEERKLR